MAIRTTSDLVGEIIDLDADIPMTGFIATANVLVNWLDGQDSEDLLDDTTLELIERWLAAHLYAHRDQLYISQGKGRSNATYQVGVLGKGLESTQYGQTALLLDITGKLRTYGQRAPSVYWGGTDSDSVRPDSYQNQDSL